MKNIIYILAVFVLCFGFKAQAQQTIKSVTEEIESLKGKEKEKLEYLLYSTPPKLIFDEEGKAVYIWNSNNDKIKNVEIIGAKQFAFLLDKAYSKDFKDAEALILRISKEEVFDVAEEDLQLFEKLSYVVLQFEHLKDRQLVFNKLIVLKQVEKFKDVVFLFEKISNDDGYEE